MVFHAWSDFENFPRLVRLVEDVRVNGKRSHWKVRLNGRTLEWDAELTQNIPNQALGWKSLNGPKHTGRINFSPLGRDTVVHVVMNYGPPGGELAGDLTGRPQFSSNTWRKHFASSKPRWKVKDRKL